MSAQNDEMTFHNEEAAGVLRDGEASLKWLEKANKATPDHWRRVGKATMRLQAEAMNASGAKEPTGAGYRAAWTRLGHDYPRLRDLDKGERSHALWLYQNWSEVSAWLEEMELSERNKLGHPSHIHRRFNAWKNPKPEPTLAEKTDGAAGLKKLPKHPALTGEAVSEDYEPSEIESELRAEIARLREENMRLAAQTAPANVLPPATVGEMFDALKREGEPPAVPPVPVADAAPVEAVCSFCDLPASAVKTLVQGAKACICDGCVALAAATVAAAKPKRTHGRPKGVKETKPRAKPRDSMAKLETPKPEPEADPVPPVATESEPRQWNSPSLARAWLADHPELMPAIVVFDQHKAAYVIKDQSLERITAVQPEATPAG